MAFAERGAFGGDVAVVEGEEGDAQLLEELERDFDAGPGVARLFEPSSHGRTAVPDPNWSDSMLANVCQ